MLGYGGAALIFGVYLGWRLVHRQVILGAGYRVHGSELHVVPVR